MTFVADEIASLPEPPAAAPERTLPVQLPDAS